MDRSVALKPLARVALPDVGDVPCSGLTLIVGPNSSGKSQLLRDLYSRLCGEPRKLVVASEVAINKPSDYRSFISSLESQGYVQRYTDDNNQEHLRPLTVYSGTGQAVPLLQMNQAEGFYQSYDIALQPTYRRKHDFLNHFGRMLVTALFLDRRLNALNSTGLIQFEQQPPQHDFHVLHTKDEAREALQREIYESFGRSVWTDLSSGSSLCLRVCDGPVPSAEDRHSVSKMSKYRTIETEGDGLKSYVAICIALLLGHLPVCLIDEPEMCLHPPQAYNLGRFIARYGSSKESATFVATHSSQVLRGIVQSSKDVEIIRLTRKDDVFSARRLAAEDLVAALEKPTLRAESVLDGIFSESVVVLEADGDRLVYSTAWETLSSEVKLDIHFAAVGGTGGIADICKLYRTLDIPVAVIADLDLVADIEKLQRIVPSIATPESAQIILEKAKALADAILMVPPTVSKDDVKIALETIGNMSMTWENGDDVAIRKKLRDLAQDLNRMRRLKSGELFRASDPLGVQLDELAKLLRGIGVFLVPVGELEGWLSDHNVGESKQNKAAWANAAALKIQSVGPAKGDVWDFLRTVAKFLRQDSQANESATA